jgi:chaperonin GroEL
MKITKYDKDARVSLKAGVAKLTKAVGSTMGGAGTPVIMDSIVNAPVISKDGVTVSEFFELQDPYEQMGVNLIQEVGRLTNTISGDGTSSATVLANAFLQNDGMIASERLFEVKMGMDKAMKETLAYLKSLVIPLDVTDTETIKNIATISAGGDEEIGDLIAKAYAHTGEDGQVLIQEGRGEASYLETISGYQIDKGYFSDLFVTNKKRGTVEFDSPYILITNLPLNSPEQMVAFLSVIPVNTPVVLIAPEASDPCILTLNTNVGKGLLQAVLIEAPEFGDKQNAILSDLAMMVGARFISVERGDAFKDVKLEDFGTCKTFVSSESSTIFIEGTATVTEVDEYTSNIAEGADKDFFKKRTGRLKGRLAKIFVGANSQLELRERVDRVEDAKNATRCAIEEGIVVGGGIALFRAAMSLEKKKRSLNSLIYGWGGEYMGYSLVREAIKAPLRQILFNLFRNNDDVNKVIEQLTDVYNEDDWGFNVRSLQFENLIDSGVIDPYKVTRTALETAYSVASTILDTDCVIAITANEKHESTNINF